MTDSTLPEPANTILLEAFEWHLPCDNKHWRRLIDLLPDFHRLGIDRLWIPPACKAGSSDSNGYDIYDLYDLGEFDQKGSAVTKWGSKEELVALASTANALNIGIVFDAVLGHKAAADYTEQVNAWRVNPKDRRKAIERPHEIEAWTGYHYHARNGLYSSMKYNATHFNGTGYDATTQSGGIFKLAGKEWAKDVDRENGNFDYLLCNNLDLSHRDVRSDIYSWTRWLPKQIHLSGFRFDSVKHMSRNFLDEYTEFIRRELSPDWILIGEYWSSDAKILDRFIKSTGGRLLTFDFALHHNLSTISSAKHSDLRKIFKNSLAHKRPQHAVTFVTNHDTQERDQSDWDHPKMKDAFVSCAYIMTLLTKTKSYSSVFWGDIFGVNTSTSSRTRETGLLVLKLLLIRKLHAYGEQKAYFDERDCIGFTREGDTNDHDRAGLAAIVTSSQSQRTKKMYVGKSHAGQRWIEVLHDTGTPDVHIDSRGYGAFVVPATATLFLGAVWCDAAKYQQRIAEDARQILSRGWTRNY